MVEIEAQLTSVKLLLTPFVDTPKPAQSDANEAVIALYEFSETIPQNQFKLIELVQQLLMCLSDHYWIGRRALKWNLPQLSNNF